MTVVVEGRKPQCWNCKQLGHFSKSCPQKILQPGQTMETTAAAATTSTIKTTAIIVSKSPNAETGDHPDKDEEGWTQVQRGRNKKKTPAKANTTTTVTTKTITAEKQQQQPSSAAAKTQSASSATAKQQPVHSAKPSSSASKPKKTKDTNQTESMEVAVNLKRRKDSGDSQKDGGEKKHIKDNKVHPQTPSQSQPKGEENTKPERPAQLIPLPQQSKNTPTDDFPLSPKSPSLSPITTPKLITRSHSVTRKTTSPPSATKQHSQSASTEVRRTTNSFYFCEDILEPQHLDHVLKKALKPLLALKIIDNRGHYQSV